MCLNKQDSECASGPKYPKLLNMTKFWIWQGSQYAFRICPNMPWQGSEYNLGSKCARILNMAMF